MASEKNVGHVGWLRIHAHSRLRVGIPAYGAATSGSCLALSRREPVVATVSRVGIRAGAVGARKWHLDQDRSFILGGANIPLLIAHFAPAVRAYLDHGTTTDPPSLSFSFPSADVSVAWISHR